MILSSSVSFASKCKIKYTVLIKKNENNYQDYAHCGFSPEKEEYTRPDFITIKGLENSNECEEQAKSLLEDRVTYKSLVKVIPFSNQAMHATCTGTVSEIRKITFRH